MNKLLLQILRCPLTRTSLEEASADLIKRVNEAISAGRISSQAGDCIEDLLESGLVSKEADLLYPIRNHIPSMLVDEAIPLKQVEETP